MGAPLTLPGALVLYAHTIDRRVPRNDARGWIHGDPKWYESPRQVLKLAGMNLGGKQSGTSVRGRTRQTKHGRPLLRRQLFLLAGRWCQKRGLYRDQYQRMLERGKPRTSAVCAIARKLVPMLLTVMQTERAFDLALWRANRNALEGDSPYRAA